MKNQDNKAMIINVTVSDEDSHLISQIAQIEKNIQPIDNWGIHAITQLLQQDVNHCWVVIDAADDLSQCQVMAYCLWSWVFENAEILRIGTQPNFRRQGYASRLIQSLQDMMPPKRIETLLLEVREDNKAAIGLYEKLGFKTIHIRKNYYQTQKAQQKQKTAVENVTHSFCDALVMQYVASKL